MSLSGGRIGLVDEPPRRACTAREEESVRRSASIGRRCHVTMSSVVSPASADEALEMLRSALGYLAAADATAMTAEEQARCLRVLERANSVGTAARTSVLGAFGSGQGYSADADYSPRAWVIHKTGVTKGAAGGGSPAGPGRAGYRVPARVGGQDRVPVDEPAPGGPA